MCNQCKRYELLLAKCLETAEEREQDDIAARWHKTNETNSTKSEAV